MRRFLLLSLLGAGLSATAFADTVTTFQFVDAGFVSQATLTGSITIDTTTGLFEGIDATVTSGSSSYRFTGAPVDQGTFNNNTQYYEYSFDAGSDLLVVDLPGASLAGYTGGNICSFDHLCGDGYLGYFQLNGGSPDPAGTGALAVTPEPSSLVLLGTGLVGAFGAARRRFGTTQR